MSSFPDYSGNQHEIDFTFNLSNPRENNSIQLYFPADTEELQNVRLPLYLYSLDF